MSTLECEPNSWLVAMLGWFNSANKNSFLAEAFLAIFRESTSRQDFQGDITVQSVVTGSINLAHSPTPNFLDIDNIIIADGLADHEVVPPMRPPY